MLISFFESFKYVGHIFPISLLRIYLGYYFFQSALLKYQSDFLIRPKIAGQMSEWLPSSPSAEWYKYLIENLFIPHWQILALTILALEAAIAISYLLGYLVRPMAVIAFLLALNTPLLFGPTDLNFYRILMVVHLVLAWVGAGRCLGVDYYFYKRRRGIWW